MSAYDVDAPIAYPFPAIQGMEGSKKALLCALVNPSIKSVLITGASGTAKTVLARSLSGRLSGRRLINIPLNITEEQLFGGMDFQATMAEGVAREMPGILSRADGNICYVDDVNLLDNRLLVSIMDVVSTGALILEREGISSRRSCDTLLIASMNPDEAELNRSTMDRFDLCAYTVPPEDLGEREEVLRRNESFLDDPARFTARYRDEEDALIKRIDGARRLLPHVSIGDGPLRMIVELCTEIGAEGHRGGITMAHASRALAALDGRDEVSRRDVEEAARSCLLHRRNRDPPPRPDEGEERPREGGKGDDGGRQDPDPEGEDRNDPPDDGDEGSEGREETRLDRAVRPREDMLFEAGDTFQVADYLGKCDVLAKRGHSRKGRRKIIEYGDGSGRYVRSRMAAKARGDVAFDATIRAAAPFQRTRCKNGLAVAIERQDLREKVRERRCGCTILFLVDASGSLGIKKRMVTVKGTILSMLKDSYIRRDHIGMMAFRRDSAELMLPPTKSVEYAYRRLEELPTGGKTPLAHAMVEAGRFMTSYSRAHPGQRCFIVLVTDGRANVPLFAGSNANEEVQGIAESITVPGVAWVVVDAGTGRPRFDNAIRLAEKLNADYFTLRDLDQDSLANGIRSVMDRDC